MSEELKTIILHLQEGNRKLGAIEARIVNLETTCVKHARLLTDGNGQPSVIQQIEKIRAGVEYVTTIQENHQKRFQDSDVQAINDLKDEGKTLLEKRKATSQNRIAVIVAIIAAVAAIVASVISAYFSMKGRP